MRVLITTTGSAGHFGPRAKAVAADVRALPIVDAAAELLRELAAERV
jgi:hypothetical protein